MRTVISHAPCLALRELHVIQELIRREICQRCVSCVYIHVSCCYVYLVVGIIMYDLFAVCFSLFVAGGLALREVGVVELSGLSSKSCVHVVC